MRRARRCTCVLLLAGALLGGCSEPVVDDAGTPQDAGPQMTPDAGTQMTPDAGGEAQDGGSTPGSDAGEPDGGAPPAPDGGGGCMTGVFGSSTFGSACFGE